MRLAQFLPAVGLVALGALVGSVARSSQTETKEAPLYYELRTYTTLDGRLPALHKRFKDHTVKLFEKHGMKNVIYCTPADKPNTLIYLLAHKDKAAYDASWKAFRSDPVWIAARDESEKDGKIVEKVESVILNPTDYSPMK
jgi:hypothetical protein